jgi:type I restriction enzyme, R subunit
MTGFTESVVEEAALEWLGGLGYAVLYGPSIAHGEPGAERSDPGFRDVLLTGRFRAALARLNADLPAEAVGEAFRRFKAVSASNLVLHNREAHRFLVKGIPVEFTRPDGAIAGAQVRVLDFDNPDNNDWLAVNQFSIAEGTHQRRPDILIFVNGLPLTVIELKNAADEAADIWSAFNQLQTYKAEIQALFQANEILAISDGMQARIGALTADRERFSPWRTIDGQDVAPAAIPALQVLLEGVFEKRRFLDLIRYFIVFEDEGGGTVTKKLAGYHQYHAVNYAVEQTLRAAQQDRGTELSEEPSGYEAGQRPGGAPGDRRIGVVWHTQGSGKSLTMAFYAGRIIHHPAMENPTIVVLTDRNDLDDQLFGTFSRCRDILTWAPVQAGSRTDLRAKLSVASGGVVFTTIQKFLPEDRGDKHPVLSDRRNIVVIADEAHRSQYDFIDGFARNMRDALPNASFIGFTGTPLDAIDKNTRAVFGDYISIYDIKRAVEDGATVPIYYESRLAKLVLSEAERPKVDPAFDEVTEGEEVDRRDKLRSKWAQLEALAGTEKRLALIAADLVAHYERRTETLFGKAMVVCMSRRICVELYKEIVKLRPEWDDPDPEKRAINIVMTGSASDPADWQKHIRSKSKREELADRFRDPKDPFQIVIVRDMWLTGFDAPCLHTMYIDKPMRGHALMQAIARVNRVFKDKPGGLVVDYLGLADELRQALKTYTDSGGSGEAAFDQEKAIFEMQRQYEVCRALFHGFDWSKWTTGKAAEKLALLPAAQEHILAQKDGKTRLLDEVTRLSKFFALSVPSDEALKIRDDVSFFQAVRAVLVKTDGAAGKPRDDLDHAIRQIVSQAIVSDEVVDVFAAAGLKKPDISILSEDFLAQVRKMPYRNLAVELLAKLLKGEIKSRQRRNVVQSRSFLEMLEQSLRRYQNRAIESAQVIEELIGLAKDMRAADARGEKLKLTPDEIAFYDALEVNDSAVKVLGDENLKIIAQELVEAVKRNVTIDWTKRESVRAQLRVIVKRILRKYGYPPDKQERATQLVLEQAEVLSDGWATGL